MRALLQCLLQASTQTPPEMFIKVSGQSIQSWSLTRCHLSHWSSRFLHGNISIQGRSVPVAQPRKSLQQLVPPATVLCPVEGAVELHSMPPHLTPPRSVVSVPAGRRRQNIWSGKQTSPKPLSPFPVKMCSVPASVPVCDPLGLLHVQRLSSRSGLSCNCSMVCLTRLVEWLVSC